MTFISEIIGRFFSENALLGNSMTNHKVLELRNNCEALSKKYCRR